MIERRACRRFTVQGATISYKVLGFFRRDRPFSDAAYPVADLSKGGLSFLTDKPLREGTRVTLLLHLPGEKAPLNIEGSVVHAIPGSGMSYKYRIGIRFSPFGSGKGNNSPEALKKLDEIEKVHAPDQRDAP